MSLELSKDYIEVFTKKGDVIMNVGIDKYVDISISIENVEEDGQEYSFIGVHFGSGRIGFNTSWQDEDGEVLKLDYKRLGLDIKDNLHLIFNEKLWDVEYWEEMNIGSYGHILTTVTKKIEGHPIPNYGKHKVIRVDFDELIDCLFRIECNRVRKLKEKKNDKKSRKKEEKRELEKGDKNEQE